VKRQDKSGVTRQVVVVDADGASLAFLGFPRLSLGFSQSGPQYGLEREDLEMHVLDNSKVSRALC
jgi:uncharacterized Ntn-hydrolase superfamily protein